MPYDFISVKQASERFGYSESHIRNLLAKGIITGEKFAGVWLINARSVERHQARMERLGKKKHGVWAKPTSRDKAVPAASQG